MDDLSSLPVKDGFRLRGLEMTRIETFTDAAFAFGLTLLVLSAAPNTMDGLRDSLRDIPAFLFGAANLMVFWHGHNEWSRRFGLDDRRTMLLSVALVCTVLIYVYPLRFIGNLLSSFIAVLTGMPIGHQPAGFKTADVNSAFVIYAAGFIACALMIILLNWHAWSKRDELTLNALERQLTLSEIGAWAILCAVGFISGAVGLLLPDKPGAPGMAYMLLAIVMPMYGATMTRRQKRLREESAALEAKTPSYKDVLNALGGRER